MAGGRGKKAPRPASGGFGAAKPPPPTLESVCAGFPTRLPPDAASTPCVCGSGDAYACCCQPYHLGEKRAESAERCVRTRYSGFAYRLPRYIIETTHRTNRDYMKDKVKWARRAHRSPTPLSPSPSPGRADLRVLIRDAARDRKLHKGNMFDSVECAPPASRAPAQAPPAACAARLILRRFVSLEVSDDDEARAEAKESAEEQDHLRLRITLQPIDERTRKKAAAEPVVVNERSRFVVRARCDDAAARCRELSGARGGSAVREAGGCTRRARCRLMRRGSRAAC